MVINYSNPKAIFFDRDGVINRPVYHLDTDEYGAPRSIEEIRLYPGIFRLMDELKSDYLLFVVSNQSGAAKGHVTYDGLSDILNWFENWFSCHITKFYWCKHHPSKCKCLCRKPGTYFIEQAIKKYNIDVSNSIFVGDTYETDIMCGKNAGLQTIYVSSNYSPCKLLKFIKENYLKD